MQIPSSPFYTDKLNLTDLLSKRAAQTTQCLREFTQKQYRKLSTSRWKATPQKSIKSQTMIIYVQFNVDNFG